MSEEKKIMSDQELEEVSGGKHSFQWEKTYMYCTNPRCPKYGADDRDKAVRPGDLVGKGPYLCGNCKRWTLYGEKLV